MSGIPATTDSTMPAAVSESVYCATLNAAREGGRRRTTSVSSEPVAWATTAAGSPKARSAA